jgi:hypothetical protein
MPEIYKQMQDDNVPVVSMDSTGVRIQTGIGEIFVPISGTVMRIEFREGSYVVIDATKIAAAYNPTLKEAKWGAEQRWVARSEAIVPKTAYHGQDFIVINKVSEFEELVTLEKAFLDPLPPDTYWPNQEDVCWYGDKDCYNPLGLLDDLSKSPVKFPVNHMIWMPNEEEGRPVPWIMITSQVFNPADKTTSLLHYANAGWEMRDYYNSRLDREMWVHSIQRGIRGLYIVPSWGLKLDGESFYLLGLSQYWKERGFVKDDKLTGIKEMVLKWLFDGKMPIEMEYLVLDYYPARWDKIR